MENKLKRKKNTDNIGTHKTIKLIIIAKKNKNPNMLSLTLIG